jgi:hypothetical protein
VDSLRFTGRNGWVNQLTMLTMLTSPGRSISLHAGSATNSFF